MKTVFGVLVAFSLVVGPVSVRAADQPAKQKQPESKDQVQKEKPKDKPSGGTQRRAPIPET